VADPGADGRGMGTGRLGLLVATVGSGGNDSNGGVMPGTSNATTLCMARAF
jgi:hypothetical protein